MTIRLPLTLAIIDGFLVRCGKSTFVIPLEHIEECIAGSDTLAASSSTGVISRRGEPLPVVSIARQLRLPHAPLPRQSIVVVRVGERRAGLLVDHLLGEHQTVIKPLGQVFQSIRGLAGTTILGSGEVALILDVPALLNLATERPHLAMRRMAARQSG
jgi:two-component system chemotaxis sensor kinase CheA